MGLMADYTVSSSSFRAKPSNAQVTSSGAHHSCHSHTPHHQLYPHSRGDYTDSQVARIPILYSNPTLQNLVPKI
ncbi:hypothetical protein P691DRAFT_811253 [Macrolepiota fuliginosa MF-IS2]|uniref:Uncharacterized protein n=1 Tax=Macrolepiota fuliginosa MF-IS2 TaxID=1400762 RepID=A0A9P5X1A5_9AGAR|nr:hypothetical protein P691DRAFT_811253 [Macrolepiota fuliginosa MF-IS2]